jgi:hypothetical protein
MRLLGKCFAISLVSATMSLLAPAQRLQPTTNMLPTNPIEQPQFGRSAISSTVVDRRNCWIAASHAFNGRIHPCYPTQPSTTLAWERDRGTLSSLQGSGHLRAVRIGVQSHGRTAIIPQNAVKRHVPEAQSARSQELSNSRYYTNSNGQRVHSPAYSRNVPAGATAVCADGTYSFSQHRSGTCSHHGRVANWR